MHFTAPASWNTNKSFNIVSGVNNTVVELVTHVQVYAVSNPTSIDHHKELV